MSNIRTPRFFPDMINFLLARGISQNGEFDVVSGSDLISTFTAGSEAELFDMKPLNKCSWDTHSDSTKRADHVLINIDLQSDSYKQNYIAILNHNLNSAKGKIRVFAGSAATEVDDVDGAGASTGDINWSSVTVTEILNADDINVDADNKSVVIQPAVDGSTIFSFGEQDLRYWGIQFEGSDGESGATDAKDENFDSTTSLYVSNIMIGEYYDMPMPPSVNAQRSITFDRTKVQESVGGQKYSTMSSYGPESTRGTNQSPFKTGTYNHVVYGGRISYDLKFTHIAHADIHPTNYGAVQYGEDTVVEDVWNITHGNHIPFIFTCDKESTGNTAEGDYIFARFKQNSLVANQIASGVYDINISVTEEF